MIKKTIGDRVFTIENKERNVSGIDIRHGI